MDLDHYARRGYKSVGGWLNPISARIIASLAEYQTGKGYTGTAGEIGVHHGKLFLLLHAANPESSFAIDVFDDQHLNTDHSGHGDREIFEENIRRVGGNPATVEIIQRSSFDLTPADIPGPVRLFSVDGGHTSECVQNDLALADQVLAPHGVVILDDYFNPCWPDVSVGTNIYLTSQAANLLPFAISPSKLYLARPEFVGEYADETARRWHAYRDAENKMFGVDVASYGIRATKGVKGKLRQAIKASPAARLLP